jgi:hypothetical protein
MIDGLSDDGVDVRTRPDVNSLRRLVEEQETGLATKPAAYHHLLLIAARKRRERCDL